MSIFCPKCGKRTYDEYTCDHCRFEIKRKTNERYNQKTFTNKINNKQNTILIVLATIITISLTYIAYSKYRENKMIDDSLEMMFGTNDIKEIQKNQKKMYKRIMEENKKMINNMFPKN